MILIISIFSNKSTYYKARHGWASAAHSLNVATPFISQALGHDSEKTTRIYLSSLDNEVIDEANLAVINAVYAVPRHGIQRARKK